MLFDLYLGILLDTYLYNSLVSKPSNAPIRVTVLGILAEH